MSEANHLYNFKDIKMVGLDGEPLPNASLHKTIAQILYVKVKNIDLVEVAININKGEPVELLPALLKEVETVVMDSENGVSAFARKAFKDYIDGERTTS